MTYEELIDLPGLLVPPPESADGSDGDFPDDIRDLPLSPDPKSLRELQRTHANPEAMTAEELFNIPGLRIPKNL